MTKFANLNSDSGLALLNKHLEAYSYVDGYLPTQGDNETFDALSTSPNAEHFPHAARYFKHIKSFSSDERKNFIPPSADGPYHKAGAHAAETHAPTNVTSTPAKSEDDVNLWDEDPEEDAKHEAELERIRKEAEEKRGGPKKQVIAKSSVILDIKPWDDSTDLDAIEKSVRSIAMDGLSWGASKLVPIAYGVKKVQIICTIIDDLVSVEDLTDKIQAFEDLVQSVDVAAFNKL